MGCALLIASYLIVGAFGYLTGRATVLKALSRAAISGGSVVHNDNQRRFNRRMLAGVLLITSAVLVGFGIQQQQFQHAQHNHDADQRGFVTCLRNWGAELTDTLQQRNAANTELTNAQTRLAVAQKAHDDASDAVFLDLITAVRTVPTGQRAPRALLEKVKHDLLAFGAAHAALVPAQKAADKAQAKVDRTKAANPYTPPVLNCEE